MMNKKEVRKAAYDLIIDGKKCITSLTDEDKEIMASLIIDGHNKANAYEFITEADAHLELPYMLANYMRNRDSQSAQAILDYMVDNAVRYAGNEIVDYLIEQEQEYNFNKKYDGGFDE